MEEFIDMMIDNQITGAKTEINNFVSPSSPIG
jgi:hypothetical protein